MSPAQGWGVAVCDSHPQYCFHGACQGAVCVCDAGYVDDLTLFHVNDCNMPTFWMTLLGAVDIAGSAIVLAWGLKLLAGRPKGVVAKGLRAVLAMQVLGMAAGVAILVQQRIGPVFLLLMTLATAIMTWVGALFIAQFFTLTTKTLGVALPNALAIKLVLGAFPLLGGGPFAIGAFGGFATETDPAHYNVVICAMLLVSPILQIVSAPVLVRSTNSLIALLRDTIAQRPASTATKAQQKQDQLLRTLTNFRNQNLSSMASYLLTTPVLAIVYLCLGAMPFMWVITFFLVILNIVVGANFYMFVITSGAKKTSASGSTGDQKVVVAAAPPSQLTSFNDTAGSMHGSSVAELAAFDERKL